MKYQEQYEALTSLIAKLRESILTSELDDSSIWYPDFISNPESIVEWATEYFEKRKRSELTIDEVLNLSNNLDDFTFENKTLYYKDIVVADELFFDWEYVKSTMKDKPELYTKSVLASKMYEVLNG